MSSTSNPARPNPGTAWMVFRIPRDNPPKEMFLELPLEEMPRFTTRPLKYLKYLGTIILGQNGSVTGREGQGTGDNDSLVDGSIYEFTLSNISFLPERMVNREVFSRASTYPNLSKTSFQKPSASFKEELMRRDADDIFARVPGTEYDLRQNEAVHIVPHAKGSEWLKVIVSNRPVEVDYDLQDLEDVDDIRNGFMADSQLNKAMTEEACGIMVTPNRILNTEDIPDRFERTLGSHVSYPDGVRFTQQLFEKSNRAVSNIDASFRSSQDMNLPSMLFLQYHYAICAMRKWGRNTEVVESNKLHRVKVPASKPVGSSRIGRQPTGIQTITKREKAQDVSSISKNASFQKDDEGDEEPKQERSMEAIILALSSASEPAHAARVERAREALDLSSSKRMDTLSWVESLNSPESL